MKVSGVVTLDGTPVTSGRIEYFPESGRPASGTIGSDGRYELKSYQPGDGARPGKYVVTITSRQAATIGPDYASFEDELNSNPIDPNWEKKARSGASRPKWLVPERYSIRKVSGLTAEVGDGKDIDFQLKSKP